MIARDPSCLRSQTRKRVEVMQGSHGYIDVVNQAFKGLAWRADEPAELFIPEQLRRAAAVLQSGAVASVHVRGGTANGTGFLFEIHGTEADLAIAPADPRQEINVQVSEFTVRGAQSGKPLADLPIPDSYRWVPPAVPVGLPFNVAQLFVDG